MLLKIDNITKSFNERPVLKGISLELELGASASILGPSGSGKSTLLNIAGALDLADTGDVIFNNKNLTGLNEAELAAFRNREVGFIFQMHHLLPQCTVLENILVPTLPVKDAKFKHDALERAHELISKVDLEDQKDQYPAVLSGGERQRVAVVRALINQPKLLLADEPTGSLDHENAMAIVTLLMDLNKEMQLALLMVTHSREIASKMDRTFVLRDGKIELM